MDDPLIIDMYSDDTVTDIINIDRLIHTDDAEIYVKLTMEHQYLRDLYFSLVGPNPADAEAGMFTDKKWSSYYSCWDYWKVMVNRRIADFGNLTFSQQDCDQWYTEANVTVKPDEAFNETFNPPYIGDWSVKFGDRNVPNSGEFFGWCWGVRSDHCKLGAFDEALVDVDGRIQLVNTEECNQRDDAVNSYKVRCLNQTAAVVNYYADTVNCFETHLASQQPLNAWQFDCDTTAENSVIVDYYSDTVSSEHCSDDWVLQGYPLLPDSQYERTEIIRTDECFTDGTDSYRLVCDPTLHWSVINYTWVARTDCSKMATFVRFLEPTECLSETEHRRYPTCDFRDDVYYLLFSNDVPTVDD